MAIFTTLPDIGVYEYDAGAPPPSGTGADNSLSLTTNATLEAEYLDGTTLLYPLKGGYPTIVARTDGAALPSTYDGVAQTYLEAYTELSETYPRIKITDPSVMLFRVHSVCDAVAGWTIDEVGIYRADGVRLAYASGLALTYVYGDNIKLDVSVDITSTIDRYAAITEGGFSPQYAQWLANRAYKNPSSVRDTRDFNTIYVAIGSGTVHHKDSDRKLVAEISRVAATAGDAYTEFCAGDTEMFTGRFLNSTAADIDVYEAGIFDAQGLLLWRYCIGTKIGTITPGNTGVIPMAWTTVEGKQTSKDKNKNPKV